MRPSSPPDSLPSVAVVVPTAGRRSQLLLELTRAALADNATSELIVVVDGAATETTRILSQVADSRVEVLSFSATEPGHHRGQEARDHGVRAAGSDVILALDDDVVPRAGLVSGHARRHCLGENLVVVGYMPVSTDNTTAAVRLYDRDYERACEAYERDPAAVLEGLWGGNVSVRREHWLRAIERPWVDAGYHGDQEFGLRLQELDMRGIFDRSLRAEHRYGRTARGLIRDAELSAASRARLRQAYGVGVPAEAQHATGAWIVSLVRRPGRWRVASGLLCGATRAAGRAGLSSLEDRLAVLLYRLAWRRAEQALTAARFAPRPSTSEPPTA
jgi:hypothetical protein